MTPTDQIRQLLKDYCEGCVAQGGDCQAHLDGCAISNALSLLPCGTCKGTGKVPISKAVSYSGFIPCIDCQPS